jgi:hypothetical protein
LKSPGSDFFFLKEIKKIPNYSRGRIEELMAKHPTKNGYYYRSLWDTHKRLDGMGIKNAIDFEVHAPIIFNKENKSSIRKKNQLRNFLISLFGMSPIAPN